MLFLDEELPISSEEFLAACESVPTSLNTEDIRHILKGEPEKGKHPFIRKWLWRETQLRNAIARERASKANVEAEPFQRDYKGFDTYTEKVVEEAMNRPNPLERELMLDRFRWKTIEDMALFDPFGITAVFAFALKFALAERWSRLVEEKGKALVESFLEDALLGKNHE